MESSLFTEKNCHTCSNPIATKQCGQCNITVYCSLECQKIDWPRHKQTCIDLRNLKFTDFDVIKQVGEGNFTRIYQVEYRKKNYALKVCDLAKVSNLRKETDILMEKHALNKIKTVYADMPCVKLLATFKD